MRAQLVGANAGANVSATYLGGYWGAQSASDSNDSFTNKSFGEEDPNRVIVCAITVGTASTRTYTVTIGGVSATIVALAEETGTVDAVSLIAYAAVPTGATGSVVVSASGSFLGMGGFLYRLVAPNVQLDATAVDTGASPSVGFTPAGPGVVIAVGRTTSSGSNPIWSGDVTLNETLPVATGVGNEASAAWIEQSVGTTYSAGCSWTGGNVWSLSVASFLLY